MPTFRYFNGSKSFWTETDFSGYSVDTATASTMIFRAPDTTNSDWMPYRIAFTVSNGTTYYNSATDKFLYTAGTITGITYFSETGSTLATVTGLAADAAYAFGLIQSNAGYGSTFWDYVLQSDPRGSLFIGSNETGEKYLDWAAVIDEMDRGDDIATTVGNDTVRSAAGSDWISDYGGTDYYDGQTGDMDVVSYNGWRNFGFVRYTGITADLQAGKITGPDGKIDTVVSIEAVMGTRFADIIRGSSVSNTLMGGAGSDTLDGRGGIDTAFYFWDGLGGIVVSMATGAVTDGYGGRDKLISIEAVVGTNSDDRFVDSINADRFDGREGTDRFTLSAGNDTVSGGGGTDTFKFIGRAFGYDHITDFSLEDGDRIHVTGATSFAGLSIYNSGAHRVIAVGASRIILDGDAGLALDAGDFIFG